MPVLRTLKYNKKQLEKTADLSLGVANYVFLGAIVGAVIPGIGSKVGWPAFVIAIIVFVSCYVFAMWLLKRR